ncbi:jacalin-related lectin [Anaeramoeba flamelloides]|uniref:Jacalin-related lectin n=1 Tax=Anaeramoeba flamelloides TaxID=1746091 RepID=A0AAV7YCX8_9EUKA|nr:jacalin-related lectin [Anaeramoeba flamelloides]|eukprot:Anaeramoba_flamelloidesa839470_237.p1 GENE.a839470_237~~a839470_237.p1  ORF type:complete len:144 (+),score=30.11 a839470_237:20-451(+)
MSITYKGTHSTTECKGGNGGGYFSLAPELETDPIISITIAKGWNDYVGKIKITYSNNRTVETGRGNGNATTLNLGPDEYINRIDIYYSSYVEFLKITTNEGNSIETGNQYRGSKHVLLQDKRLIGFYGHSGDWLDAIGCLYED